MLLARFPVVAQAGNTVLAISSRIRKRLIALCNRYFFVARRIRIMQRSNNIRLRLYTVSQKRDLYTFAHNFGRCSRIFEIFPLLNSSINLQQTDCHTAHHTLHVLLHYLVSFVVFTCCCICSVMLCFSLIVENIRGRYISILV